ncbi:hypothetical protein NESM_000082200 [Novymonas esmeraldas]|uniref:Uncharacterized protein n=1 Tax=Novymonas esmeraldas TaxID=1808958 RepID=A0AAW0F4Y0_9TRYP
MRRAPSFHAAHIRSIRRLCPPRRHLAVTHAISAVVAPGVAASVPQLVEPRAFYAYTADRHSLHTSGTSGCADSEASAPHTTHGNAGASQHQQQQQQQRTSAVKKRPGWTEQEAHAALRRCESLCQRTSPLSAAPLSERELSTSHAAGADGAGPSQLHHSPLPARPGTGASAAAVHEVWQLLDSLALEPQRLSTLADKQRHRFVSEACRLGHAVGLHSRCCTVYAEAMLLPRASRHRDLQQQQGQGHAASAVLNRADEVQWSVPDFVIAAAGEVDDLATLQLCLDAGNSTPAMEAVDAASPSRLTALHVYAQCIRVWLRRGWHSESAPATVTAAADAGAALPERDASTTTADTSASVGLSEQQRWHDLTLEALRHLSIRDGEAAAVLRTSLQRARYRHVDTGGDWSAAQAVVYAQVYQHWLGDEVAGRAAASSPRVLLTVPALVTLMRTAVSARQHDVAEWATLCVDACLEEWGSPPTDSTTAAPHERRLAAPLPPTASPSTQTLPQLDTLLALYLRHLQQSGQRRRAVRWLSRLRRLPSTAPVAVSALTTLPVAREAARIAGDELDAELATWCLELCLGASTAAIRPSHADILHCLCAYARCGLPNFESVLHSLHQNELLRPSLEELLYVRLLHARRSVNWRAEWEACIAPLSTVSEAHIVEDGTAAGRRPSRVVTLRTAPLTERHMLHGGAGLVDEENVGDGNAPVEVSDVFSPRVVGQALLVLQEGEHGDFMAYYRAFLHSFSAQATPHDRGRWVMLALLWATQLRGSARQEDLVYIAREVEQLTRLQRQNAHSPAPSRPTALPAEVWRGLSRNWAVLYQQYPPSLWSRAVAERDTDACQGTPPPPAARQLLCTPSAAALATTPGLTRFAKRRRLLPAAVTSATELLRGSHYAASAVRSVQGAGGSVDHRSPPGGADVDTWIDYLEAAPLPYRQRTVE